MEVEDPRGVSLHNHRCSILRQKLVKLGGRKMELETVEAPTERVIWFIMHVNGISQDPLLTS